MDNAISLVQDSSDVLTALPDIHDGTGVEIEVAVLQNLSISSTSR